MKLRFSETLPTSDRWAVSLKLNSVCADHWTQVRLGDICRIQNGAPFPSSKFNKREIGFPLIRIRDVGNPEDETTDVFYSGPYEEEFIVSRGEILIGMDGEFRCRRWLGPRALLNQRVCRIFVTSEQLNPSFLYAVLQPYLDAVEAVTSSVTVKHLSSKTVADLRIVFPPLNEQRRIVAKIEALQTHSNAAKQALDAIPPLLEAFRQSVLAAAFRGDLTKTWRERNPDVEPASVLLERIRVERKARFIAAAADKAEAKARAKALDAGKSWTGADAAKVREKARAKAKAKYVEPAPVDEEGLPELPEGWCWASAETLAWEITVGHVGPMKHRYQETGVPFLRSQNVRPNRFDATGLLHIDAEFHEQLSKSSLSPGDLLVVRSGAPGTACVLPNEVPRANCSDLVITRLLPGTTPRLVAFFVNSEFAKGLVKSAQVGMAQQHFNVGSMRKMPVPVSPLQEQQRVLENIESLLRKAEALRHACDAAADRCSDIDQSILAKAFRGELVPQDPNDEPAHVLLERIRAERAAAEPTKKTRKRKTKPKATRPASPEPEPAPTFTLTPPVAPPKQLDLPADPPRVHIDDEPTEVMALIRQHLRGRATIPREDLIHALADGLGYQRVSAKLRKRLDGHLRAAVRRGILEPGGGDEVRLATRRLDDYDRDALVSALRSVSAVGNIYDREDLARDVLQRLGFRRLTKGAKAALKSAMNAAIRRGRFERVDATRLRRLKG